MVDTVKLTSLWIEWETSKAETTTLFILMLGLELLLRALNKDVFLKQVTLKYCTILGESCGIPGATSFK